MPHTKEFEDPENGELECFTSLPISQPPWIIIIVKQFIVVMIKLFQLDLNITDINLTRESITVDHSN